jgi:hypothetical protein
LDQFLEDLLDIGIPQSSLVRLGGKSTVRTEPFSLFNISKGNSGYRMTRNDWTVIDEIKRDLQDVTDRLKAASSRYMSTSVGYQELFEFLEFEYPDFHSAFEVPSSKDGMQQVTRKGKPVGPHYLLHQWTNGWDAGMFRVADNVKEAAHIWDMPTPARKAKLAEWESEILKEQVADIHALTTEYNSLIRKLDDKFDESNRAIIRSKRVIGCTTTAAAKYRDAINAAEPSVVLVEEAGEILESHTLTSLSPKTRQLILIGDHK